MALSDLWYSPGTLNPLQPLSSKGHPVSRLMIFRNSLEPHLTLGAPFLIAATNGIACGVFCVHFWMANRFVLSSKSNKTYCVLPILSTAALLKVTPFRVTDARGPVPPKDTTENPVSSVICLALPSYDCYIPPLQYTPFLLLYQHRFSKSFLCRDCSAQNAFYALVHHLCRIISFAQKSRYAFSFVGRC